MLETGNMVKTGIDDVQAATVATGLKLMEIKKKVNDQSNLIIDMGIQINEQKEELHQLNNILKHKLVTLILGLKYYIII
jgi:hypothetical protein